MHIYIYSRPGFSSRNFSNTIENSPSAASFFPVLATCSTPLINIP